MYLVVVLALFLQSFTIQTQLPAVTKSDMPPTISVKMSPDESKRLEHAQKAVADASAALEKAKSAESDIRYDIIKSHRGENIPLADCQWGGAWSGGFVPTVGIVFASPEPKGYLGSINGNWVVFTKGFQECHGV